MPLYALALFAALLGYDQLGFRPEPADATLWTVSIAIKIAVALAWWRLCRRVTNNWSDPGITRSINRLYRFGDAYGPATVLLFLLDLALGTLAATRNLMGDLILLDELAALLPTLLLLTWRWVPYEPIDRWLREAVMTRRMIEGQPVYPSGSRTQYVTDQLRHQLAPILLPMVLILGWLETLNLLNPAPTTGLILMITGVAVVMLLAAPLILSAWRTQPVGPGELRDDLEALCARQGVRPGGFRLWITEGRLANAAVLGLAWPLRYVLISDTILDHLPKSQVLGVLAHEVAHVRERHALWLGLGTLVVAWGIELALYVSPFGEALVEAATAAQPDTNQVLLLATLPILVALPWILAMGFLSRRFERQADAAGARELSAHLAPDAQTITPEAADTMCHALGQVASLNGMNPARFMWRHGSIHERQVHLRSLVGKPHDQLPIDNLITSIRRSIIVAGILGIAIGYTTGMIG
ncbi:M48 family metallopeptidase [Mucisphaera calidilacus]|uniref:Heat shock protein HtpX n=1 Tax=Mucisphaera calidilacus TaxID=2527982 RepID=A0A518BY35_9BACT|nr:M48 family metallopeptidase [Mucisphaera calidilacus]QDU71893.1 heat shock protein HtpX [Mucisphaera calidilacus]